MNHGLLKYVKTVLNPVPSNLKSITKLMSVESIAQFACFYLTQQKLSQHDVEAILTEEFQCPQALYFTIIFGILLLQGIVQSPLHPIYSVTETFAMYFARIAVQQALGRLLFPWEVAGLKLIVVLVCRFVYNRPLKWRQLVARTSGTLLGDFLFRVAAYAVETYADAEQVGNAVERAVMMAKLAKGRAEAFKEEIQRNWQANQ